MMSNAGEVAGRAAAVEIWDMVYQPVPELGNTYDRLDRFHAAGVAHVSLTLAGDDQDAAAALRWVARARREVLSRADKWRLVYTCADVDAARAEGRLALSLHFEGTECFQRDLDLVEAFHRLGVRQALIAFNVQNSAGGGCAEANDSGLSAYGRTLVREMERVGMLVDLSHVGRRTALDIIALSSKPVIFSHSNPAGLYPHWRNVGDEVAAACAATGGVLGVSGSTMYMDADEPTTEKLFEQVDYYVQLVGAKAVGFGFDTFFEGELLEPIIRSKPEEWPGQGSRRLRYSAPEQICGLIALMRGHGYSEADVGAIASGNFRRVCGQVWR